MKAQTQRTLRQYHHYLGVLFAPAILFFAFTGALQTFSLHEAKGYDGAAPPAWIAWIASVHKDQAPPHQKAGAVRPKAAVAPAAHDERADDHAAGSPGRPSKGPSPLPLKIFVLLMAAGLICSSLLGVTIALNNRATRRVSIIMLVVGAILPLMLLWV